MSTHTVFDRTLLRAGETVSMKHYARIQTRDGLAVPAKLSELPGKLLIQHQGSDQRYEQAVSWKATPSGGVSAINSFVIPKTARLGMYTRSEEHTSELQSLMRISYAVFCLKKKKKKN